MQSVHLVQYVRSLLPSLNVSVGHGEQFAVELDLQPFTKNPAGQLPQNLDAYTT